MPQRFFYTLLNPRREAQLNLYTLLISIHDSPGLLQERWPIKIGGYLERGLFEEFCMLNALKLQCAQLVERHSAPKHINGTTNPRRLEQVRFKQAFKGVP